MAMTDPDHDADTGVFTTAGCSITTSFAVVHLQQPLLSPRSV